MHNFPVDPAVMKLWFIKSGSNVQLSSGSIGMCSAHFSSQNYKTVGTSKKRLLKQYAIPDENLPVPPTDGIATFGYEVVTILMDKLRSAEDNEEKMKFMTTELQNLKTQLKNHKANEERAFSTMVHEKFGHIFTANQIDLVISNKNWKKWGEEDMAKAIAIYNSSSSCYEYLRNQLNYPLPSKSCVFRWSSRISIEPGLIKPVLAVIQEEFRNFTPMQRQAVLCFDEVSVDSRVSLVEKNQQILGPCKNMMAISVRGLFYPWKQLIYFDFDLRLTKEIIFEIVTSMYDVGINVVALVSDMSTINIRVWNELGIDIPKNIFSFNHPITAAAIWMFADFCHMLKLLRNHFIDHPIKLGEDFGNITISKKMIQELLSIQKDDIQIAFKLTDKHINMNSRERMNVRTAFELFSETTSKALLFILPEYKVAAEFFQLVNDFSDLLNSHFKSASSNPYKCPFGTKWNEQKAILQRFEINIAELRVQGSRRPATKPFQKGFKLICGSIQGLFQQMQQHPVSCQYILTSHLNQDFMESGFGTFRGVGGFNDLPLPADAISRVKTMVIAANLKSPTTGNVLPENSDNFTSSSRLKLMSSPPVDHSTQDSGASEEELASLFSRINPLLPVPLSFNLNSDKSKLCGIEYIAGFIAKKLMAEHPNLRSISESNEVGWVEFLSDGQLVSPSRWWLQTFLKFEQYFHAFHKSQYPGDLCLNRKPFVINRLSDYLRKIFPTVPEKATRFYVRLRTKIRINAINKKIVIIRKKRRAQAFINSVIMAEDEQPEEPHNGEENEANSLRTANIGPAVRSTEADAYSSPEDMEIDGVEDGEIPINNLQEVVEFDLNEFEVLFDDEMDYNPMDFDVFDEEEVLEAME